MLTAIGCRAPRQPEAYSTSGLLCGYTRDLRWHNDSRDLWWHNDSRDLWWHNGSRDLWWHNDSRGDLLRHTDLEIQVASKLPSVDNRSSEAGAHFLANGQLARPADSISIYRVLLTSAIIKEDNAFQIDRRDSGKIEGNWIMLCSNESRCAATGFVSAGDMWC
jgi:hypothetical protein